MTISTITRRIDCLEILSRMWRSEHINVVNGPDEDEEVRTHGSQNSRRQRGIKYMKSVRTEQKRYERHERMMESMEERMKTSNHVLLKMMKR